MAPAARWWLAAAVLGTALAARPAGAQPRKVLVAPASGTNVSALLIQTARGLLVQRLGRTYRVIDMDGPPTELPLAPATAGVMGRVMRAPVVVTMHMAHADGITTITATGFAAPGGGVVAAATERTDQGPEVVPMMIERLANQLLPGDNVASSVPRAPPPASVLMVRRHFLGGQIGGSGFLQGVYRFRALGPLHLEAGAFGAPHVANVSLGTTLGALVDERWFPHVGLGVGAAESNSLYANECPAVDVGCKEEKTDHTLTYGYARGGLGIAFGAERRHMVAVELAVWRGRHKQTTTLTKDEVTRSSRPVTWWVPGVSYYFTLF